MTAAVAAALGIRDLPAVAAAGALADALARRQLLLVLDNCEHVIGAARRWAWPPRPSTLSCSPPRGRRPGAGPGTAQPPGTRAGHPRRPGAHRRADRRPAVHQRAHGQLTPGPHPRQDRMPAPRRSHPPRPQRRPGITQPAEPGRHSPCGGVGDFTPAMAGWQEGRNDPCHGPGRAGEPMAEGREGRPVPSRIGQGNDRTTYPRGNSGQDGRAGRHGRPRTAPGSVAPGPPGRPGDELRVRAGRRAAGTLER